MKTAFHVFWVLWLVWEMEFGVPHHIRQGLGQFRARLAVLALIGFGWWMGWVFYR